MRTAVVEAGQHLGVEQQLLGERRVAVGGERHRAQRGVVLAIEVQHEIDLVRALRHAREVLALLGAAGALAGLLPAEHALVQGIERLALPHRRHGTRIHDNVGDAAREGVLLALEQAHEVGEVEARPALEPHGAEALLIGRVVEQGEARRAVVEVRLVELAQLRDLLRERIDGAVPPHSEGCCECLEAEVATHELRVQHARQEHRELGEAGVGGDVHRRDRGGLERAAPEPRAGQREVAQHLQRVVLGRCCLPDATMRAHDVGQALELAEATPLRGNLGTAVRIVGEIVEGQRVGREADVALLHGGVEQGLHLRQLVVRGQARDALLQTHDLGAQHRMRDHRHDIDAQRKRREMVEIALRVAPVDLRRGFFQHVLGHVLDAREAVDDRLLAVPVLAAEGDAQGAVGDDHGRRAVADDLRQARVDLDLEIEMRVRVEESRHHPMALCIDHFDRLRGVEAGADGRDLATLDGDVGHARGGAIAVEQQSIADQEVPLHGRLQFLFLVRSSTVGPPHDNGSGKTGLRENWPFGCAAGGAISRRKPVAGSRCRAPPDSRGCAPPRLRPARTGRQAPCR